MRASLRSYCVNVPLFHRVLGHFKLVVGIGVISKCYLKLIWISIWFVNRYYLKQKYPEGALFSHNHETDHIVTLKEAVKWSLIAPLELLLV